jgi:colanic acid/amylovoran biosynthesis glycosyltransferase
VVTFHGYDATFKFKRKSYVESLKRHFDDPNVYIFLACDFFKNNFTKNHISLEKARVVYCGIDIELFKRNNYKQSNPFQFLQISSFHSKKGHYYTVMAFKKMLESHPDFNCQLIFGGDGPHYEEIKQLTIQLGMQDKIFFKGMVSPLQAKALLEEANCFVHHSITSETGDSEACTNSIMEAMAMELPVLSTIHGGIPEMVIDGVHGYLVEEKDIDNYAKKMWEIKDWGFLKENRNHIQKKFEIGIHIKNLEDQFQEIIRNTK